MLKRFVHAQMVDEARRREEDALSLLREELQAKAAENKSLQVHRTYCFFFSDFKDGKKITYFVLLTYPQAQYLES